jgi:fibronectin-binding autotransporter adhesin
MKKSSTPVITNTTPDPLRGRKGRLITLVTLQIGLILGVTAQVLAANATWNGGGQDRFWKTPANWTGGVAPTAGDSLFFGGTTHTTTTNNFLLDTPFANFTFNSPAGFFTLAGNEVALTGNITNKQVVTPQTISLPLLLSTTPTVSIVPNGVLTASGVISGVGGLTVSGGGTMNLKGANPFLGSLTVNNSSTVVIGADTNLGAGGLVLNSGTLSGTASFALNPGRGIAVGPGWGGINVPTGLTLSYGGVIADNGGTGGLTKSGYGTLSLSGANTYTGPTTNAIGTMVLDFAQPGSPATGIINSSSSLELGGGNAGGGAENVAQLIMSGGAAADVQNFNGTFGTFGGSAILATNRTGGSVNLGLGALSHSPGGTIAFVTPTAANGHVTTTSPNVNGILGGYALISGDANAASTFTDSGHTLITGTNFAAVDGSGNIVNFTGYSNVTAASTVAGQVAGSTDPNITINDTAGASVVNIAADNAGTTVDLNAIKWTTASGGFDGISIGAGNTLRLGQFGGIIRNGASTGNAVYIGGPNSTAQTGSGTTGNAGIGTLTAGGPNINTPGEIVVVANNPSETSGTTILEPTIADNGTGPVTVVKMGPGSIKLDGNNTFSGGLYLLQGRVQFAGSEIGNNNPDGGGVGPIFVLPGAYLFPSGIGTGGIITNSIFVAGAGDAHEPLGAFRGGTYSGTITLIGDASFGGNAVFNGPIVGPFSVTLGSAATVNGGATLNNSADNWTGDTILTARSNTGNNTVTCGDNNVIPNGFGYGNMTMVGFSSGRITWDLNGFNETVNGLSSAGTDTSIAIENNASATTATLTIGNNDQSGTFGGVIEDLAGQTALTKVGGGIETLTGVSTYTGSTIVNGGILALSGSGSISGSTNIAVNAGATLDVSDADAFSAINPVQLNGGTLIGNGAVGALTMNNGALTLDLNPSTVNVTASSLALGGNSNVVNISSVNGVTGYPTTFTILQYSGALSGGMNFVIGAVPNDSTGGYISNDVAHSRVQLVLTNGPAVLTWVGGDAVNPTFWDDSTTTNWLAFKGTANQAPSAFQTADPVNFDDTGSTTQINLTTILQPGFITVSDNTLNYAFTGVGALTGTAGLIKSGSGTLTLLNTGGDNYKGGVAVNGGTVVFGANNSISGGVSVASGAAVQVGLNTGAGTLPGGNITDDGSITFNRGANLTVSGGISGAGTITKQDTSVLTLSGNNGALTGPINTLAGTLQAGSGNALGTSATTISSGATLDVNGQTLNTTALVTVSGAGVNNQGAIINSGADSQNALGSVTLAGNTTFGGTNRWDIRGGPAQLNTSPASSPYSLTKVGPNFIGLVGVTVDPALANIDIQQGTLDYEGSTSGLGDPNGTLTVEIGATFELYNSTVGLTKNIVLNGGTGTNDTLVCGNNTGNNISGPVTLNGACVFNAASGTLLTFNNALSGSGSMIKIGAGTNTITGGVTANYTGSTTVSNGTLVVNGTLSSATVVVSGATLAGMGTIGGSVALMGGTVSPGDIAAAPQATLTVGNLTLSNATAIFELSTTPSSGSDVLAAGNLTLNGTNTIQITPLSFLNVGDTYTLITYTGATLPSSATNQFRILPPNGFFSFAVVDPSTTPGAIEIKVLTAVGNDIWTGAKSSTWDNTTTNWTRNGTPANFNDGDVVTFDDSSSVTTVSISGTRTNSGINELSFGKTYTFSGTGSLAGPGGLDLEGIALTIANSGTNTFTGPITIANGELQVGNGGTSGNVGSGAITNNGSIVFNRSDANMVVANAIRGTGSLTNAGPGRVTLTGASAFTGGTTILQGTLRILNSAALGAISSPTIVSNGATLDFTNNVNFGQKSITASGAGVGGNGAIINSGGSSGFVAANFAQVTMTTNLVFGGSGRMDFRASSATAQDAHLFTTGGSPSLVKVGTNSLLMAGVQIDATLGDILVGGGTLGFQWQMPSLGDVSRTLSVSNGASIAFFDMSNAVSKVLSLNGASVLAQHGINNEFDGPVTLNGTDTFNVSSGAQILFANEFSGPGNLIKTGPGTLTLSLAQTNGGAEIYSGNTYVGQGTLALLEPAALTNSPTIILTNATLDVSGRTDGTLTLGAAIPQTLAGGGIIKGALVENSGSTVNPGNGLAPAVLTVSNSATLNGSVVMNLKRGSGVTNDEIVASSISAAGTLTVANLGADLHIGDQFKLFNVAVPGFTSAILPAANAGGSTTYQWRNDVAVNGSITLTNLIVSAPSTNANITKVSLSGTNLLVHGTNNNVPNTNFEYVVLTATNVMTPLSNWTPVVTNRFNADGTFDYTNPIVPGKPMQFIDVRAVP